MLYRITCWSVKLTLVWERIMKKRNYRVKKAAAADAHYGKHLGNELDNFLKYIIHQFARGDNVDAYDIHL